MHRIANIHVPTLRTHLLFIAFAIFVLNGLRTVLATNLHIHYFTSVVCLVKATVIVVDLLFICAAHVRV